MKPTGKLKILVVDDSPTIRHQIREILSKYPYDVEQAVDGFQAIEMAEKFKPDVVLMDVQMPDMDGLECIRRIRHNFSLKKVRIIMVTGENGFEKKKEAFDMGCSEYLCKPISEKELLANLEKIDLYVQALHTAKHTLARASSKPAWPL